MASLKFPVTGDDATDQLISDDPFARVVGMLLDQQITMEKAFAAPYLMQQRLGERLTPDAIASRDPDEFDELFRVKPALHRFPGAMAKRVRALSDLIIEKYDGDTERIWTTASDATELLQRLRALPGFGDEKAKIFVAVLAKRFGIRPAGWEAACAPFSDDQPRSVADIGSRDDFTRVRAWKKAQKAKGLSKQQ